MTYHFEVLCSALGAVEVAGEQHVTDIVAGAVVEFPHVEGSRFKVVEVGFDLETLQNALLHQVHVSDLIPLKSDREGELIEMFQQLQISCLVVWYGLSRLLEQHIPAVNNRSLIIDFVGVLLYTSKKIYERLYQ